MPNIIIGKAGVFQNGFFDSGAAPNVSGASGIWSLDGNYTDSSGNSRDAFVASGNPTFVSGKYGQAVNFDGNDWLEISNAVPVYSNEVTIACWIKTSNTNSTGGSGPNRGYIAASLTEAFRIGIDGGVPYHFGEYGYQNNVSMSATTNVADGNWHHLAVSYDGPQNVSTFYVDGVAENTINQNNNLDGDEAGQYGWLIGQSGGNPLGSEGGGFAAFRWRGDVDECRFYIDKALTQSEIQTLAA